MGENQGLHFNELASVILAARDFMQTIDRFTEEEANQTSPMSEELRSGSHTEHDIAREQLIQHARSAINNVNLDGNCGGYEYILATLIKYEEYAPVLKSLIKGLEAGYSKLEQTANIPL